MRKFSEARYLLAITLWVGGLWALGYIAAPVLFASLNDRQLAGVVAGKLFAIIGWVGLGSAAYLILFLLARQGGRFFKSAVFWLVLLMALMSAASKTVQVASLPKRSLSQSTPKANLSNVDKCVSRLNMRKRRKAHAQRRRLANGANVNNEDLRPAQAGPDICALGL